MSARTDALVSQQETGKITASIVLRCGRLPPGMSRYFNADRENMFPNQDAISPLASGRALPARPCLPVSLRRRFRPISKLLRNAQEHSRMRPVLGASITFEEDKMQKILAAALLSAAVFSAPAYAQSPQPADKAAPAATSRRARRDGWCSVI